MPRLCREVGANELKFVHMVAYSKDKAEDVLFYDKDKSDACISAAERSCFWNNIKLSVPAGLYKPIGILKGYTGKPSCVRPEKQVFIRSDGSVKVCMLHDEVIGNLYEQDFYDIWNGERYKEFRGTVNTPNAIGLCANCPEYDSMDIMDEKAYLQFERKQNE